MVVHYSVELWDHELGEDGAFSSALASEDLGGPSNDLGFHQIGRALRCLRSLGWSDVSMYVSREDNQLNRANQ